MVRTGVPPGMVSSPMEFEGDARITAAFGARTRVSAALFTITSPEHSSFYFSPGAVTIARGLIQHFGGVPSAPPSEQEHSLVLLVGHPATIAVLSKMAADPRARPNEYSTDSWVEGEFLEFSLENCCNPCLLKKSNRGELAATQMISTKMPLRQGF
jgi:hypothetical protein